MKLIKLSTKIIYEYRIINGEPYISPICNNKRIKNLNIDYLLVWIGKDIDNSHYSDIFDLVKEPTFKENENHLVVDPIITEEIIFSDSEELFEEPHENGLYKLNMDCISPQTTDLFVPLHKQCEIDKNSVSPKELLEYLNIIKDKYSDKLVFLDYEKPKDFLKFIKKEYSEVYDDIKSFSFNDYQKEIFLLLEEAFEVQTDVTDPDYDFMNEITNEIEDNERLSSSVTLEHKNNVLQFKTKK